MSGDSGVFGHRGKGRWIREKRAHFCQRFEVVSLRAAKDIFAHGCQNEREAQGEKIGGRAAASY